MFLFLILINTDFVDTHSIDAEYRTEKRIQLKEQSFSQIFCWSVTLMQYSHEINGIDCKYSTTQRQYAITPTIPVAYTGDRNQSDKNCLYETCPAKW